MTDTFQEENANGKTTPAPGPGRRYTQDEIDSKLAQIAHYRKQGITDVGELAGKIAVAPQTLERWELKAAALKATTTKIDRIEAMSDQEKVQMIRSQGMELAKLRRTITDLVMGAIRITRLKDISSDEG